MQGARDSPLLYRVLVRGPTTNVPSCDQTVLGTPIPVAHSTASQKAQRIKHHTFVVQHDDMVVIGSDNSDHSSPLQRIGFSPLANEEPSILNINSMPGLSGSVLDPSLDVKGASKIPNRGPTEKSVEGPLLSSFRQPTGEPALLSVEEAEAENREIEIDQTELKLLEDAFGDLDGGASEAECTVPTKACATSTIGDVHAEEEDGDNFVEGGCNSGTTVSSLTSKSLASNSQRGVKECAPSQSQSKNDTCTEHSLVRTPPPADVKTGQLDPERVVNVSSPPNQTPVATSPIRPQKRFSNLPCLSGLSSTLDTDLSTTHLASNVLHSGRSIRIWNQTDQVPRTDDGALLSNTAKTFDTGFNGPYSGQSSNECGENQIDSSIRTSNDAKQTVGVKISGAISSISSQLLNNSRSEDERITPEAKKRTDKPVDSRGRLDQTSVLVSRLHLSDVDGLLDIVHKPNGPTEPSEDKENCPLGGSRRIGRRLTALQRILRPNPVFIPTTMARPSDVKQTLPAATPKRHPSRQEPGNTEAYKPQPPSTADPLATSPSLMRHEPYDAVTRTDTPTATPALSELQSGQLSTGQTTTDVVSKGDSLKTTDSSAQRKHSGTQPVLLSNLNCLVFCGAVCGQIHHQHLLIKHQLPKPVTLRLLVSPGGDVFKLTDERGYLLTGPHSVCIPPGLEYPVHVAYAVRQPLTWDTGQLRLSIEDDSTKSTWKVRLIGYSSSSQLECCCCTRLNSEIYWTTATPLSNRRAHRKSSSSELKINPPTVLSPTTMATKGTSVACVVLTNFGLRAAWVLCNVEPRETCRQVSNDKAVEIATGALVEPSRMVIGPRQSQNIVITMQPGVESARVTFFYGDEVLRHQVRQYYIRPPKSVARRRIGRHVKVIDLMEDFTNEIPFQITEMPPRMRHPVRPEDWYQALSKQLHLREHFVLNVYSNGLSSNGTENPDQTESLTEQKPTSADSSPTLTSIVVREDAFGVGKSRQYSSPVPKFASYKPQDCSQTLFRSTPSKVTPLRLEPEDILVLPSCHAGGRSQAEFRLRLDSHMTDQRDNLWQVECTLHPHSKVNWSNCSKLQPFEEPVFISLPSPVTRNQRPNSDGRICGLLALGEDNSGMATLRLPFEFRAPPLANVYRQRWQLSVWAKPCSHLSSEISATNLIDFVKVDTTYRNGSNTQFDVVLEGQCLPVSTTTGSGPHSPVFDPVRTIAPVLNNTNLVRSSLQSSTVPSQLIPLRRHARRHKLGPLLIEGIPVIFSPVSSESEEYVSTYQLELLNCMESNTVFVQLELPKPPFHVVKPVQTRFRIIPRRWVRVQLAYRPTEAGSAKSILGIQTMPLPSDGPDTEATRITSDATPTGIYRTEIPLAGFMR
ncbi:hypothetical protein CRM22_000081 [Opisthorchis felineus]|uniref:Uncharacterized protein n=1 Tax=Opisthorchis felineus TaxID=147828 RepID=A0A4S2MNQ7_OPIFE|nr:hypothetical protein CRM22_000081 [Opisthorchis felineus]